MPTYRNQRKETYVNIDKVLINDPNLSYKAKGILIYILSKPNDWITREHDIVFHATDGRDGIRSGLKELLDKGYMTKEQKREDGKFSDVVYNVFETSSMSMSPPPENPPPEKPTLLINDSLINDSLIKEKDLKPLPVKNPQREVSDYFCDKYFQKHGQKYVFNGAKDATCLKALVGAYGKLFVMEHIDWFFKSKDPFISQNNNIGILKWSKDMFIAQGSQIREEDAIRLRWEEIQKNSVGLI